MQLSATDFTRLAGIIEAHCGIKMPPTKKLMVEGRLRRRVRALALADIGAYCRFLFDKGGLQQELVHLIDVVTTNKTDFFREPRHFEFLVQTAVPRLMAEAGAGLARPFIAWSAACSTGQEPYTMAMVLAELAAGRRDFRWSIRASDISSEVLEAALRAVYPEDVADPIAPALRARYLLRSRNRASRLIRVVPELRAKVAFRRLNLIEGRYPWPEPADVIFCRNVLIYFDRPTQQQVLSFLCDNLRPGGYLFLGHSETLAGYSLPVDLAMPAVYRRRPA